MSNQRPPRVLIVDDNAMNVDLVSYVLSADAIQVATAADASEAMARIAAQQPDLILMDIQLPGVDGLELTRRLKADPATRPIVILALTAYAMKGDEARMRAAGCDGYIAKPIDVATFAGQVRAWLS
jgi:CheY-like chemotaxis protein